MFLPILQLGNLFTINFFAKVLHFKLRVIIELIKIFFSVAISELYEALLRFK